MVNDLIHYEKIKIYKYFFQEYIDKRIGIADMGCIDRINRRQNSSMAASFSSKSPVKNLWSKTKLTDT